MKSWLIFGVLIAVANGFPRLHHWKPLIVGGRDATQGEVPYQLSLRFDGEHFCGASIVTVEDVQAALTAAHCLYNVPPDVVEVVAGEVRMSDKTGFEQSRKIVKAVSHESFDRFIYENDIALLFLDEPFDVNDNVAPVPLPNEGAATSGNLVVSGWGHLKLEGKYPDVLQLVEIPIVSDEDCEAAYAPIDSDIFPTFICAGNLESGGKDACLKDSGGPAISAEGGYLAGIVSWGEGCATPEYPGVYTEVSHFIDWIRNNVEAFKRDQDRHY